MQRCVLCLSIVAVGAMMRKEINVLVRAEILVNNEVGHGASTSHW